MWPGIAGHDLEQAHAVHAGSGAEAAHQARAGEVQRHLRTRHVGDDGVEDRLARAQQAGGGCGAESQRGHLGRQAVGPVRQQARTHRVHVGLGVHGRLVHQPQALQRIGNVGAQGDAHHRDHVAAGAPVGVGAHIHGRAGHQAALGQFALRLQVAAHRARDDREHHVVHRRALDAVLHRDHFTQVEIHRAEHAMRRDAVVEARVLLLAERTEALFALALAHPLPRRQRLADHLQHAERLADQPAGDAAQHLDVGVDRGRCGLAPVLPAPGRRRHRLEIVQRAHELHAGGAVDRRVVDLQEHREAARRQPLHVVQPLDDVGLPQRPRTVESARVQAGDLDAELAPVAGLGQRDVSHVELDVGVVGIDPERVVQIERHHGEAAREHRGAVDALAEGAQHILEAHQAVGCRGRIVDEHRPDVHRGVVHLAVEEHRVLTAELLHRPLRRGWCRLLL